MKENKFQQEKESTKQSKTVKGYKVFGPDWICRGFQYKVGEIYEMEASPILCRCGFHFCIKLADCYGYYAFEPCNKVAEVEAFGEVVSCQADSKCATNKIKIVREISWYEVLDLMNGGQANTGYYNDGRCNTGHYNTGSRNTGNHNRGWENCGSHNAGNLNTGGYNMGDRNTGYYNIGSFNTGDDNGGLHNCGDDNSGNHNTGNYNAGFYNAGSYNSGSRNSGNGNDGAFNSGDKNSGNYNSGNSNTGDYNSGSFNSGNCHSGMFNTIKNPKLMMFDNPSDWTYNDWVKSAASSILDGIPEMQDGARQAWWDNLPTSQQEEILSLPNFDAEIFEQCTRIKVQESGSSQ